MGFLRRKYREYKGRYQERRSGSGGSSSTYRPLKGIFSGSGSDESYTPEYEERSSNETGKGAGADGFSESDILLKSEMFGGPATMPFQIILWKSDREYITHVYVHPEDKSPPYRISGHYFMERAAAEKDYRDRVAKERQRLKRGGADAYHSPEERMRDNVHIQEVIKESIPDEDHAVTMYQVLGHKLTVAEQWKDADEVFSIVADEKKHLQTFRNWWRQKHGEDLDYTSVTPSSFENHSMATLIDEAIKDEADDRQKYLGLSVDLHKVGNHSLAKDVEMIARDEDLHYKYFVSLKEKLAGTSSGKGAGAAVNRAQIAIPEAGKLSSQVAENIISDLGRRPTIDYVKGLITLEEDEVEMVADILDKRNIQWEEINLDLPLQEQAAEYFTDLIESGWDENGAIYYVEQVYGKGIADALWAEVKSEEKEIRGGAGTTNREQYDTSQREWDGCTDYWRRQILASAGYDSRDQGIFSHEVFDKLPEGMQTRIAAALKNASRGGAGTDKTKEAYREGWVGGGGDERLQKQVGKPFKSETDGKWYVMDIDGDMHLVSSAVILYSPMKNVVQVKIFDKDEKLVGINTFDDLFLARKYLTGIGLPESAIQSREDRTYYMHYNLVRKASAPSDLKKYLSVDEKDGFWYVGTTPHKKADLLKHYDIKEDWTLPTGGGAGTASSFRPR